MKTDELVPRGAWLVKQAILFFSPSGRPVEFFILYRTEPVGGTFTAWQMTVSNRFMRCQLNLAFRSGSSGCPHTRSNPKKGSFVLTAFRAIGIWHRWTLQRASLKLSNFHIKK